MIDTIEYWTIDNMTEAVLSIHIYLLNNITHKRIPISLLIQVLDRDSELDLLYLDF